MTIVIKNLINVEIQISLHPAVWMTEGLDCERKQTNPSEFRRPWYCYRYQKCQDRSHQGIHRTSTLPECLRPRCIARSLHFPGHRHRA